MKKACIAVLSVVLMVCLPFAGTGDDKQVESPTAVILRRADYAGQLEAENADFNADFVVEVLTDMGPARIKLLAGAVGLTGFKTSSRNAAVEREGDTLFAVVQGKGDYRIHLEFGTAVESSQDVWKTLSFTTGPALVGKVDLSTEGEDSQVELGTGTAVNNVHSEGKTRVTGFLGADSKVEVRWQAKVKDKKVRPVVLCNVHQLIEISTTLTRVRARLAYEVPQGVTDNFEARVPASLAVVSVTGDKIRDWSIDKQGEEQLCRIQLLKPVTGRYILDIVAERAIEGLPSTTSIPEIKAGGVDRQGGTVVLLPDEVLVNVTGSEGLNRINAAAAMGLAGWDVKQTARVHSSYQFAKPDYQCVVSLSAIKPEISVTANTGLVVAENRTQMSAQLLLDVAKAGIFRAELNIPDGFAVTDVTGDAVDSWDKTESAGKIQIKFKRKVLGQETLTLLMERTYPTLPDSMSVTCPAFAQADRQTGTLGISPAVGIALLEGASTNLRSIPVTSLTATRGKEVLGYSFRKPEWSLSLKTKLLQPCVSAEIFNLITLGDGFLTGSATINYLIENAGVQELVLAIPDGWQNMDITGVDIRRRSLENGKWHVYLQDRVLGGYTLAVTYDQAFDPQSDLIKTAGVKTEGTTRENGYVAVISGGSMQVSEAERSRDLRPMDERELPVQYRTMIEHAVLKAYGYTRQPYALTLKTLRHEQQIALDAIADHVKLVTVVAPTGRRETQVTYLLKNIRKDNLRVQLPPGAKLWTALVDGKAVKPELDKGTVVVSLRKSDSLQRAFPVELTYVEQSDSIRGFPGTTLSLAGPQADLQASYAQWEVYLPSWIRATDFAGTVRPERGTSYSVATELDLVSGTLHKLWQSHLGSVITVGTLAGILVLLILAYRAGYGRAIGTGLVVLVVVGVLAAISIPSFVKARNTSQQNACINNLRMIDSAKEQCALAERWGDTDEIDIAKVNQYIKGNTTPVCSCGGRYIYGRMDENPRCSHPGHHLPVGGDTYGYSSVIANAGEAEAVQRREMSSLQELGALTPGFLPIRIGLPTEGKVWLFSKVLNTDKAPLRIEARLVSLQAIHRILLVVAAILVLSAILVAWRNRKKRSTISAAFAVVLLFFSVAVFSYAEGVFYHFMMGIPPILVSVALAGLLRRGPRTPSEEQPPTPDEGSEVPVEPDGQSGAGAVVSSIVAATLLFSLPAQGATNEPALPPLDVHITKAEYSGTVTEGVATFDGKLQANAIAPSRRSGKPVEHPGPVQILLLGKELSLRDFSVKPKDAKLMTSASGTVLYLPRPGAYDVTLSFISKPTGDATGKRVRFDLPPSVSTVVNCSLDEREAAVVCPTAVSLSKTFAGDRTNVRLVLGPASSLDLQWVPRIKKAREAAVSAVCRTTTRISVGDGAVLLRNCLSYQVMQGEMLTARIGLPNEVRLLKVTGEKVRTWEITGTDTNRELIMEAKSPLAPTDIVTIDTEIPLPQVPARVNIAVPSPRGVQRTYGFLAIDSTEDFDIKTHAQTGLQQIDAGEVPADLLKAAAQAGSLQQSFQFSRPDFLLALDIHRVRPEVKTIVTEALTIGDKDVSLGAVLQYDIKKTGLFDLGISVPAEYEVESVQGEGIRQWRDQEQKDGKEIRVAFVEKVKGPYVLKLALRMSRVFARETSMPSVIPLDAQEYRGFVAVGASFGVTIMDHKAQGLTAIPISELPSHAEGAGLAFKFRDAGWRLSVISDLSLPWIQVEGAHVANLNEGRIAVVSDFAYTIQNAPIDRLDIVFPANAENIRVIGSDIRQEEQNKAVRTVVLQSKLSGAYSLRTTYDVAVTSNMQSVTIPVARTQGSEREQGVILVSTPAFLHVTEQERSRQTLLRAELQDLPQDVLQRSRGVPRLAYRYLRQDQNLVLGLQRFESADMLDANVESAKLTSVLADDGQMMTLATYTIRNAARQHVQIDMPEGSQLWSCYVAGEPVRAAVEGRKILVPIAMTTEDEPACQVQFSYVGKLPALGRGRKLELVAPVIDVPVQNTSWEMYLPKGYTYDKFGGTATRNESTEVTFREFGLSEYCDTLISENVAKKKKAQDLIGRAEKMIQKGDLSSARRQYRQAKEVDTGNTKAEEGLRNLTQVEAMANNSVNPILNSDADYNDAVRKGWTSVATNAVQTVQTAWATPRQMQVAQEQTEKIHKIQTVPVSKTSQIRVSLPVEGYRHIFEQLVWAPGDEPVSVTMKAEREIKIGFFQSLLILGAGFALVAFLIAGWMGRKRVHILVSAILLGVLYVYIVFM